MPAEFIIPYGYRLLSIYKRPDGPPFRRALDGGDIAAEYSSTGALLRRDGFGLAVDEPIVAYDASGNRSWLYADERGSIVAAANSSAGVLYTDRYDEYGAPPLDAGGNDLNSGRFQYTGQMWLPQIGVYYYKARMYSPTLGRFMQTDPIGYNGDGPNLYAYVLNDPINFVDPSGLNWIWACVGIGPLNCGLHWQDSAPGGTAAAAAAAAAASGPGNGRDGRGGNKKKQQQQQQCTVARQVAGELAEGFNNVATTLGIADAAAALATGVGVAGEGATAGADTGLTIAAGGATIDLTTLTFASGAAAGVLKSFANGGDPGAVESFGFSEWASSRAEALAESLPVAGPYAKLFGLLAGKAADLATDVKKNCGN